MACNPALDFIPNLDDWTQRLKETPYDPREDIRQEHESWLAELEGLAVEAIAKGNWEPIYNHIASFPNAEASADELQTPSASPSKTTAENESNGVTTS